MPLGFWKLLFLLACACLSTFAPSAWADTLRRGLGPEPDSLHIHRAQGLASLNLLRDLREGLLTFDAAGELAPGVAASWKLEDGGRRYQFTLRPDARWSNGDAVTAEDFVRAMRQAVAPESQAITAGLLIDIKNAQAIMRGERGVTDLGVEAAAPGQLRITLEQPAPWILEILAHPVSFPLHASMGSDLQSDPVNGPYLLTSWTPRSVIQFSRNPAFHDNAATALDSVEYFPIEEPATELARFRAGELDITETIPAGRFAWLKANYAGELRVSPYLGSFWLGLNLHQAELGRSQDLRQALSLAVNRDTLVRVVLGAGEIAGWGVVPPGIAGYEPQHIGMAKASQAEREEEAQRLYAAAGFSREQPLLLQLRYNTSSLHRRTAIAVAAMWKQVLGVNTELISEEWKVFVNNRRLGVVTEVFRGGWIADFADPTSFLALFMTGNELNTTFYSDVEFDSLMEVASGASGSRRMEFLQQAEARLLESMPLIPLYYYVSRHLVKSDVQGFTDNIRDVHLSRYLSRSVQ